MSPSHAQILDQQVAQLLANAPTDFAARFAVQAIAPVLKTIALELRHTHYYIIQNQKNGWALSSLSHRQTPELAKNVVYAYSDRADANTVRLKQIPTEKPQDTVCQGVGIVFLLFQLVSMKEVDSLILFEQPTNTNQGTEIVRAEIQQLWEAQVQKMRQHLA
jgi:hypothetical protein